MNEEELIQKTRRLIGQWDNIRIVGQGWTGDARRGFQFNPVRTSPVSQGTAPVVTCPPNVLVQFSGITFDCGCTPLSPDLSTSFVIEDEGNVNSLASELTLNPHAFPLCGDCLVSGNPSFWEGSLTIGIIPDLFIDDWNNPDCSGIPADHHLQTFVFPVLILLSGIYYLFAVLDSSIIFYATSTSITGPFINTLSCNPNFITFSDPGIMCFNNGSPNDYTVIGHGGTATVTPF